MPTEADEVLAFWFGREGEPGYGEFREAWFRKDPEFDQQVQERFGPLYERAAAGELDGWREEARSCLALVICLDQFPRNMFRGDGRTHATDDKALETARYALERALDRELPPFQRRSVELFRRLAERPGAPDLISYAVGHMEIVERFGRFPHRNVILGRETTPEEAEFLQGPDSSF